MFRKRAEAGKLAAEHLADQLPGLVAVLTDIVRRAFGCRHAEMSRPFTMNRESYRVCLYCGARRQFVPELWETKGHFYR